MFFRPRMKGINNKKAIKMSNNEEKFYYATGLISKRFYKEYIKDNVSTQTQKKFQELLKKEGDDFIEYYRVSISNPNDSAWEFSSLWFFDINLEKGLMPVFLSGINTSSCLAMELCGMDREENEGEENAYTMDELLDFAPNGSEKSKETLKKLLLLKKV